MKMQTQPSLSRDFALLSVFIVFIWLLASIWVSVETFHNYQDDVAKQMESEALRLDRALIVEIENASYILESVGRQIQATSAEDEHNIAQLFFSFAKTEEPSGNIFSWINKKQMVAVSSNLGVLETPIDVSDRDYVKKSIAEPWKLHIGRPIQGRLSKKWVVPLALGLTDKGGNYIGTVIISLDTNTLGEHIARTLKDSGIHFAITNTALTLLTQAWPIEQFFTQNFDVTSLAQIDFDKNKQGMLSSASLFNRHRIYSYYESSSQYPYILFLGLESEQSSKAIRALLVPRLVQLLVIALFLLFVLYTVRKRIIHPVIELTGLSAAIVRGERFDEKAARGPLEIEHLAHEIKRLYDYIEERRRVEAELRSKNGELTRIREAATLTNQVKAEFFAYVGQELTDPVEIIIEQNETIKDQQFGPVGNARYLMSAQAIDEQASQLLSMLGDIQSISRAETGLLALNESEVDVEFVLQKTVRIFRDKLPTPIDLQLDVNPSLPRLRGDELRLKQLVLHVLNAISFQLGAGDTIRITSALKSQELSLIFSYIGNDATRKSAAQGRAKHSLDLAMARLLVALHQGTVEMKTRPERVTTVTVKFPAIRVV